MDRMQGEIEIVEIAKRSVIIEHFALDKLFSTYYIFCVLMLMSLLLVRKQQRFYPVQVAVFAIFIRQYSSGGRPRSHPQLVGPTERHPAEEESRQRKRGAMRLA